MNVAKRPSNTLFFKTNVLLLGGSGPKRQPSVGWTRWVPRDLPPEQRTQGQAGASQWQAGSVSRSSGTGGSGSSGWKPRSEPGGFPGTGGGCRLPGTTTQAGPPSPSLHAEKQGRRHRREVPAEGTLLFGIEIAMNCLRVKVIK
uniref:Uncharacterized protein n=1 Tax=Rousettus aegyptiacus TaxID=9407 RepID=A0A7J8HRS9_ROUAE|nr:hypothetical protein HJG63_011106 [Rousettus aegyptiacus]